MRIAYRTDDVPQWGTGAFNPIPMTTPLASTGGTQIRTLTQWDPAPDPQMPGFASVNPQWTMYQGSYAQPSPVDRTAALGGAFLRQVDAVHHMSYNASAQNMGPWAWQKMAGMNTNNNPLPVPAGNPGRTPLPAMRQPPWGTVISTAWPRPFITWPTWGTSRQA